MHKMESDLEEKARELERLTKELKKARTSNVTSPLKNSISDAAFWLGSVQGAVEGGEQI